MCVCIKSQCLRPGVCTSFAESYTECSCFDEKHKHITLWIHTDLYVCAYLLVSKCLHTCNQYGLVVVADNIVNSSLVIEMFWRSLQAVERGCQIITDMGYVCMRCVVCVSTCVCTYAMWNVWKEFKNIHVDTSAYLRTRKPRNVGTCVCVRATCRVASMTCRGAGMTCRGVGSISNRIHQGARAVWVMHTCRMHAYIHSNMAPTATNRGMHAYIHT